MGIQATPCSVCVRVCVCVCPKVVKLKDLDILACFTAIDHAPARSIDQTAFNQSKCVEDVSEDLRCMLREVHLCNTDIANRLCFDHVCACTLRSKC